MTLSPALATAEVLDDVPHGFSLTVPPGYAALPVGEDPSTLHRFGRGTPGQGPYGLFVVSALGGALPQGRVLQREVVERTARAAAAKSGRAIERFEYRTTPWGAFALETVVSEVSGADTKVVTLATQVPLAAGAVQVMVLGPAADEATLASEHAALLAALKGPTNWLTVAEQQAREDEARGAALGFGLGLLVVGAGAGLVTLAVVVRRARARRTRSE